MNKLVIGLSGALLAGAALVGWAQQGRIDVRTAVMPMGTSSSNGMSFAWFYDPTDRTVYVCRAQTADALDCKAKAQLP